MPRPEMSEQEMRQGFREGRTLCQEEWATATEISTVDKLEQEGLCKTTPWEYSDNFQCKYRYAFGIKSTKRA